MIRVSGRTGCIEIDVRGPVVRCNRPGDQEIRTTTRYGTRLADLGRSNVVGGPYCEKHGGRDRAIAEADRAWPYLAPASVGDDGEVVAAGCRALCSAESVVVIRREEDEHQPELWVIRCGLDDAGLVEKAGFDARVWAPAMWSARSEQEALDRQSVLADFGLLDIAIEYVPERTRPRKRPWGAWLGLGSYMVLVAHEKTEEAVLERAVAAWRERVDRVVEEIRAARGGVLDWGLCVEPAEAPTIVRPRPGESAWDAYAGTSA